MAILLILNLIPQSNGWLILTWMFIKQFQFLKTERERESKCDRVRKQWISRNFLFCEYIFKSFFYLGWKIAMINLIIVQTVDKVKLLKWDWTEGNNVLINELRLFSDWVIDFNGTSTHLGLFYAQSLGNCNHCMYIFYAVFLKRFFVFILLSPVE